MQGGNCECAEVARNLLLVVGEELREELLPELLGFAPALERDLPAVALALGGTVKAVGPSGERDIDLDSFYSPGPQRRPRGRARWRWRWRERDSRCR